MMFKMDGMEILRMFRDEGMLIDNETLSFLGNCDSPAYIYYVIRKMREQNKKIIRMEHLRRLAHES